MNDSLPTSDGDASWSLMASLIRRRADAIRTACILEATAPKVGNVHPAARFHDLAYRDFVIAADVVAETLGDLNHVDPIGSAIATAVQSSVAATGTNVNLGIILLLAPLLASEPGWEHEKPSTIEQRWSLWQSRIESLLGELDTHQGGLIAGAIAGAGAGGMREESLGEAHPLDVTRDISSSYDIIAAMELAAPRDRIARQYADGFRDLLEIVVPTLRDSVAKTHDLLSGIVHAHITVIAAEGDSLIARKCGLGESKRVAGLASDCLAAIDNRVHGFAACVAALDAELRTDDNRLNPGTSADLIAAAIYVILRTM
ncbi:triphosphoribosyl-dephospho-CoA synthase [Aporhodopirellula aestuarii]|uniref:Triphosphoribosyl-dephospho-CoA synthase n=1 Tax=Aporhodopirellula aestuarii TaxID=2950107 RepID=A0ABT0U5T0_9BACT|nr:triphosphoribosyl-dephospho-CoA synthase [Aporhodopirellula aestuarii]MCM2371696.1 triphosphoribosyl-dephospho-CoA synthase [Aporhodopirellula aestuarii]